MSEKPEDALPEADRPQPKDKPWVMRTYAGHSSAAESNALYRKNLAKGQTGLSVAFDLPTQTGYDPDSPLSRGEVGKVGVAARVHERINLPGETVQITLQGLRRITMMSSGRYSTGTHAPITGMFIYSGGKAFLYSS